VAETAQDITRNNNGHKKVLRSLDMTLFTICAIHVIDTLAPSAAIGPSTISWWIITLVLFFIPYGLITAELGTTYPEQGGIYVWVKKAFGDKWAARTTWLYWINVALWMPSVYILFAGMFSQLFFPDLVLWVQIAIGIFMTWITVWIGTMTLGSVKWIPNIGAILKTLIMVLLGVGAFFYAGKNGMANDLSFQNILPKWGAGLAFLPVIVFNFMGFELVSGASAEMKNPSRDIPRAIIISGISIALFYVLGTVGILMALPLEKLGLVTGIIDTLSILFGGNALGDFVVLLLGIAALYTFLANMVTWTIGANRTVAEASKENRLPAIFGLEHPVHKTPVGAFILTGIISTVVIILFGFMAGSTDELFWTLFAFSSMVFLMPYLALFPAFLKLRSSNEKIQRPYKVPGGKILITILAIICELFVLQAIVFFVWVPGEPIDMAFAIPVVLGVIITLIVGEFLITDGIKKAK